jgi:hypothetical protein
MSWHLMEYLILTSFYVTQNNFCNVFSLQNSKKGNSNVTQDPGIIKIIFILIYYIDII